MVSITTPNPSVITRVGPERDDPVEDRERLRLREHHAPDRVDAVGGRVQTGDDREPAGSATNGKIAPDRKIIGCITSAITIWKLSMRSHAARDHDAERRQRERQQQHEADHLEEARDGERDADERRERRRARGPATTATEPPPSALPNTSVLRATGATSISRMKPNSRSQTIAIAENSADVMHRHREDPGEQVLLIVDAGGSPCAPIEVLEAGAEHEQEQQRLRDAGDDPRRHAEEADEVARARPCIVRTLRDERPSRSSSSGSGRRRGAGVVVSAISGSGTLASCASS